MIYRNDEEIKVRYTSFIKTNKSVVYYSRALLNEGFPKERQPYRRNCQPFSLRPWYIVTSQGVLRYVCLIAVFTLALVGSSDQQST